MKYIDSEKLIAEIERLHKAHSGKYGCDEVGLNLEYLEDFIASLQQEQTEVDLDKAFESYLNNIIGQPRMWHPNEQIEWGKSIARYFAEWGAIHLNAKKEE